MVGWQVGLTWACLDHGGQVEEVQRDGKGQRGQGDTVDDQVGSKLGQEQ